MQCFIIVSTNPQKRETFIQDLFKKRGIDQMDISTLDQSTQPTGKSAKPSPSIGIEDTRRVIQKLFLKPFKSPQKALVIKNAYLLTREAQNSLLKTLEEPPAHTIIVLEIEQREQLLPTIQSRCKIIVLADEKKEMNTAETEQFDALLITYKQTSIAAKLKLAQEKSKQKEAALQWIETMLSCSREALLKSMNHKEKQTILLSLTKQLVTTHKTITTTNVSPRMTLENLLLS